MIGIQEDDVAYEAEDEIGPQIEDDEDEEDCNDEDSDSIINPQAGMQGSSDRQHIDNNADNRIEYEIVPIEGTEQSVVKTRYYLT